MEQGLNWLITGGCGFLGSNLIHRLRRETGHRVRVLDDLSVGTRQALGAVAPFRESTASGPLAWDDRLELVCGNIMDADLAASCCQGADVIVHLAANTGVPQSVAAPRQDCLTNVVGTFNCLEGARRYGVRRFIFASSGAPVGECQPPITEDKPARPVSPYGASKLAGEGYCSAYFRSYGLETVALRFGNVYGPRSSHKGSAVAKFIRNACQGEPLEVYGDGHQTRDFIYVDDLIEAVMLAASCPGVGGEVFQIATSRETTVAELVELLQTTLAEAGLPTPTVTFSHPRQGDVLRNFSDTSKAERLLGWRAEIALAEGLRRTVQALLSDMATPRR